MHQKVYKGYDMHRQVASGFHVRTGHLIQRWAAFVVLALTPFVAYGLGRLAWDQAQAVVTGVQLHSGSGLSTLSLGQALSPVAAAIGALVAAHLAWTAVALLAAPRRSRLRAAVTAMTPAVWRRIVTVATAGTLSVSLAIPATASTDTATLDSTDAGWVTTPVAATVETGQPAGATKAAVTEAATEATSGSNISSQNAGNEPAQVKVSPGDTLWDITATQLDIPRGDHGAIASAWPELYAENRDVIGEDPGLIVAGQQLTVPAEWTA